jgi:hypothetical protein
MEASLHHRLSPITGVITLAIGIGLVSVVQMFASLFADPVTTHKVEPAEILIARPGENPPITSPATLEFSCYDLQIAPIWKELKNDKKFKARIEGLTGIYDCAGMLEVKQIDLNSDGQPEILARGKDEPLCGNGLSGCGLWVFSNREDRHRVLLSSSDIADTRSVDDLLRKSRTRGYSDLLLKNYAPYDNTMYSTFTYNGRDYFESRCVYEVPKENERSVGAYEIVQCEEYERRADP